MPDAPPTTAAIRNVELVSVGTWAASTGVTTVTRADLEAMLAAHADHVLDQAPVKLGHESPLNAGIGSPSLGDGEPAYGWVIPTRIDTGANGRETLFGDLVGMPSALAEVAPTAYRRRSVEIAWGVKVGAKSYAAVLTAVALLGVSKPAVKGLADVVALYTAPTLEQDRTGTVELVTGLEDNRVAVAMLTAARVAGADVDAVTALAAAAGARDTADLPQPTADATEDAPTRTTADTGGPQMPDAPATPPTTSSTPATPASSTGYTDVRLRELLGLEADADVDAALRALTTNPPAAPAAPSPATGDTSTPAPTTPATTTPAPATPAGELVDAGAVATLSAGQLAELQRDAAWARDRRRAEALDAAVTTGRITPAERGLLTSELRNAPAGTQVTGFAAALERDEDGTIALLTTLAPRFATTELGSGDAPTATADKAFEAFESSVFPDLPSSAPAS